MLTRVVLDPDHHEPYFNAQADAVDLYRAFQTEFGATRRDLERDADIVCAYVALRGK